jgi:excisionase family DNA binding protein
VDKLLLTPEQAADVLSIGRTKLYELLATGELTSIRLGGCRRIPADAIRQFVAELGTAGVPRVRDYLDAS